ncbi:MAG: coenzyme F420-0:L-glutamate ligase [Thermoplasmata archaeon]|nr:MAG: coenzyme F420-0:L-glutamate ligase [Thermoplasmata archaeon]
MRPAGPLRLIPLPTPVLEPGDDLPELLKASIEEHGEALSAGDVLVVASKAVAMWEGRVVDLDRVEVSALAEELALGSGLPAAFCQVAMDESDMVLGGVPGALLTYARGIMVANGGADLSNVPGGKAILWPRDAWQAAHRIRAELAARCCPDIAVVVVDSHVQPLRFGTVGMALGWSGIAGVEDVRGRSDLFGKPLHVTRRNVADMLASTGTLVMGEADESTPAVLVRGLDARPSADGEQGPDDVLVPPGECLFTPVYMGALMDLEDDPE